MSSRVYKEFGNNGRVLVHAFGAFGDRGDDNRDCRMNKNFWNDGKVDVDREGHEGRVWSRFFMLMAK